MKKILSLFVMIFLPCVSHAANMCIKNDAVMVVLDPQVNGTALANDVTGKTWSTKFSYGVISGIGACSTNVASSQGGVASDQTNMTPYTGGTYCYCKMLRPIESPWVFSGYYSGSNYGYCANGCASECSVRAASAVALRRGLFGNIGI